MQHIPHFPEWENWLIQGYLLGKSEKAKHPRAQRIAAVTLPTLAGLLRSPEAHQGAVLTASHTKPAPGTSSVTLSYLSGSKHYQNTFLPQGGTWGWTGASDPQEKTRLHQPVLPGWPFSTEPIKALWLLHALKTSQCKPQQRWLRTEPCRSHPRLLELELLNNVQHEALQPSCQPISF